MVAVHVPVGFGFAARLRSAVVLAAVESFADAVFCCDVFVP